MCVYECVDLDLDSAVAQQRPFSLRQNQLVTDADAGPVKVSDKDPCVSLLPDFTASASHPIAFISTAAFDSLLLS